MRLILTLMTKNKTVMQKKVNIFPILQFLEHCISVLDTSIQQHLSHEWGFIPAKANKRLVLFAAVRQYADGDVFAHKRWSLLMINRASHCAEARILPHSAMDCSHACPPTKSTRPNGCKSKETEVQRVKSLEMS